MSNGAPAQLKLPDSYASVGYTEIKISNVPATSKDVTPVIICELYRPKHNNAFTDIMTDEMEHFFATASVDPRVKVIVLTGQGKIFCVGQDLQQGFRLTTGGKNETEQVHRDGGGRVTLAIHQCTKPTIAALQGHAVGVGITMTLGCAMRLTHHGAKVGFVFGRRGIVTEGCSSFFLPRLIGNSKAQQLLLTGGVFPAGHKYFGDLFAEVLDKPEEVVPRAIEIAKDMAQNVSTVSSFMMREMIWRGSDSAEGAHLLESRVMGGMRGSAENDEGVNSFLEKRPVNFKGTIEKDSPPVYPWFTMVNTKNKAIAEPGPKANL